MRKRLDKYVSEHDNTKLGVLYVEDAIIIEHITTIMGDFVHGVIDEHEFKSNFSHLTDSPKDLSCSTNNAINRLFQIAKWARLGNDFELEFGE